MNEKQKLLSQLPSVDEILKGSKGIEWLSIYPRRHVIRAIREIIDSRRQEIMGGFSEAISAEDIVEDIEGTTCDICK